MLSQYSVQIESLDRHSHAALWSQICSARSGQHKKQELRVRRLQAEHRVTYLFLGSSIQNPEQEKTEQNDMDGEE